MSPAPISNPTARLTKPTTISNRTAQQDGTDSARNETNPSPLQPTPHAIVNAKEAAPYYVTLTITRDAATYITIIQLGDSFPTTFPVTNSQPTSPPKSTAQRPGIPTGDSIHPLSLSRFLYLQCWTSRIMIHLRQLLIFEREYILI
jgi:hypothetical protein